MARRAELDLGWGLRAKCKSLSKTTWKHHERWQNNLVENAFQRFALSFVSLLRIKHDFRWRTFTFVWRILFEEPRIWTSGFNLRTRVLKSVTAAQERLDMRSGCQAAKILPVRVRGTKNVWCLSSLIICNREDLQFKQLKCQNFYVLIFAHTVEALVSRHSGDAKKMFVTGVGLLRKCKNAEFVRGLRKTAFCEGGRR